jgi:hypothetical protein
MKSKESLICVVVLALIYTSILCNCKGLDIDNASPTDFVGDAFNKLPSGWIVYTVPNETRVGNNELVEARVARNPHFAVRIERLINLLDSDLLI